MPLDHLPAAAVAVADVAETLPGPNAVIYFEAPHRYSCLLMRLPAYQDRDAGRSANRGRPTEEGGRSDRNGLFASEHVEAGSDSDFFEGGREQRGRGRGGRGGRGGARGGGDLDRRSRTGVAYVIKL